jgi:hypothetical protein
LPLAIAVQSGRPANARMVITSAAGRDHEIEVSAVPIMSRAAQEGSLAIFWPVHRESDQS